MNHYNIIFTDKNSYTIVSAPVVPPHATHHPMQG